MTDADLCFLSIAELASLMRARTVSPVEVTEAHLARIERLNPTLNAFVTVMAAEAREAARRAEADLKAGRWRGPGRYGLKINLEFRVRNKFRHFDAVLRKCLRDKLRCFEGRHPREIDGFHRVPRLALAAGLNLYYAVQNIAALPQQWILTRERAKAGVSAGASAGDAAAKYASSPPAINTRTSEGSTPNVGGSSEASSIAMRPLVPAPA